MIRYIRKLASFENPTRLDWIFYFAAFLVLHVPAILNFYQNDGANNAYLRFAESLLNGSLALPPMDTYNDMIAYNGAHYLPYPPLPSLLLAPFVAIFGYQQVNTVFIVVVMSCLNLFLLHKILVRLKAATNIVPWLILAFFFGTGYWFALFTSHHVYSFAHITSLTFQLLLLNELLGRKRWWLAGVYIGCSFLTRQFTFAYIFIALGFLYYAWKQNREDMKFKHLVQLGLGAGFFFLLYAAYNYVRFGNPMDPGYSYIIFNGVLRDRVNEYGVFSARYFLFNFYSMFIKGFNIEFEGVGNMHIKDMDLWGTSLLSASPFLVAAVKAKWARPLAIGACATIGVILTGTLFYHNNGFHQINTMRFSLDFLPLLFLLFALGVQHIPAWLLKGMIVYAILLNILGFLIHFIYQ